MNFLIDCTNLKVGGGIQVASSFINDLRIMDSQDDIIIDKIRFIVVLSNQMIKNFDKSSFSKKFHFIELSEKVSKSKILTSIFLKRIETKFHIDKVFCVFGPSYYQSRIPKVVGYALPHYIYINSPFFKDLKLKNRTRLFFLKKLQIFLFKRNSNILIFETEDAQKLFSDKYKFDINKTRVVSNTLNAIFHEEKLWSNRNFDFTSELKIFVLSSNYPHKNLKIIPHIIDTLRNSFFLNNFKFVISLNKNDLLFPDKYDKYIDYLGYVPLSDLPNLYKSIDFLLMPTLLECFSTTYLEAMFMKVPIIASDMSFARDICGKSALYYNPTSAFDAASKIFSLIDNFKLTTELKIEGHKNLKRFGTSMDRTKRYIEILENS